MKIGISLCAIYFLAFTSSIACECDPPIHVEEALEKSTFAIVGKCVIANTNWMSGGMKYSFEVEASWKKTANRLMLINAPFEGECGGMKFQIGDRYLIFVEKKFSPKTNSCMGTRLAKEDDLKRLGESMAPQTSVEAFSLLWIILAMVIGFSAILIFVLLKK